MERCEALEAQLQSTQKHFKEVRNCALIAFVGNQYSTVLSFRWYIQASSRRQLEEEVFRRQLVTAKSEFDKKLVKLALKAKDRCD